MGQREAYGEKLMPISAQPMTVNEELKKAGRRRTQWKKYGEKTLKRKSNASSDKRLTNINRCDVIACLHAILLIYVKPVSNLSGVTIAAISRAAR